MATEGNKRAYAPHLVREIAEYFDDWKFFGDNQGSTVYYCLEAHDKIWDQEDGTFSLIEIAAHARQEMAKAGWFFIADADGSVGLIHSRPEIDIPFFEKFECYNAVDEAEATLACVAAALQANAWADLVTPTTNQRSQR